MMGVQRRGRTADGNRLLVGTERKQRHVPHRRSIDREEGIARAEPLRLLQRLQTTLRLAAAGQGVTEAGIAEREVRIQIDGLRKVADRQFGTTSPRVTESKHEMTPGLLVVERHRSRACVQRLVGELADRRARIQIEQTDIGPSHQGVGMGVFVIEADRLPQKFLRTPLIVRADAPHMRQRLHDQVPCVEALRRLAPNASRLGGQDLRQDRTNDPVRDLVLKLEDIFHFAIVFVRPQMDAVRGIDQLPGDTNPVGDLSHAALEDISHAELACDSAHVDRFTFEGETRIARDDEEPALPGQARNNVLGQPVGEVFLFRIAAHVLKGQHGDRRLVR